MSDSFKSRMARGERLYGAMVTLPTPSTAEILADAGFDWLFVDGEHGPLETGEILSIVQAVGDRVACLVRIPALGEAPIKKVLDLGVAGVIVPQVNSADQAADAVRFARYAPQGTRGVGLGRAHGYGMRFKEYLESANDQTLVIVQAEHALAVENIDEIVRVPGIDAVQVGPYDLSASMGKMGQINDADVVSAIDRIVAACHEVKLPIGCFGVSAESLRPSIDAGCTLICGSVDTIFLGQGALRMLKSLRELSD